MSLFARYIGIDYSGAATDDSGLSGLRVYVATPEQDPSEAFAPPPESKSSRSKFWTRRRVAHWLVEQLSGATPAIVGIDHGFSFPCAYFERHGLAKDWPAFLNCKPLSGDSHWRRLAEIRTRAKSVFHFGVPGSVAHSTHTGLPWLRHIRLHTHPRPHFWPFDGWALPPGRSVLAEVYPALWSAEFAKPPERTQDQHDAYSIAAKLKALDAAALLPQYANPPLNAPERATADIEGWIFGVR